jgi:ubiquinone/menaquinone biosynthesis C-methylase UbiE
MIAKPRSLSPPHGAPIEWREGDAAALDLADDSFDILLCQQGRQFLSDRRAAAREMRRVLAPGGRTVLAARRRLVRPSV